MCRGIDSRSFGCPLDFHLHHGRPEVHTLDWDGEVGLDPCAVGSGGDGNRRLDRGEKAAVTSAIADEWDLQWNAQLAVAIQKRHPRDHNCPFRVNLIITEVSYFTTVTIDEYQHAQRYLALSRPGIPWGERDLRPDDVPCRQSGNTWPSTARCYQRNQSNGNDPPTHMLALLTRVNQLASPTRAG
jgi:hypothetical protein